MHLSSHSLPASTPYERDPVFYCSYDSLYLVYITLTPEPPGIGGVLTTGGGPPVGFPIERRRPGAMQTSTAGNMLGRQLIHECASATETEDDITQFL